MATIEVDFDVFKELTNRRATESISYNDVIRSMLGLDKRLREPSRDRQAKGLTSKGVFFPEGTIFRATYKGRTYTAEIKDGVFYRADINRVHPSFSHAAVNITGKNWNGWRFWECKRPSDESWQLIENLRAKTDDFLV